MPASQPFRTLRMSSKEIVEEFPDNQMIKQVMDGKRPMPSDPARRAVFQVQIARLQEKKERKAGSRSDSDCPAQVQSEGSLQAMATDMTAPAMGTPSNA